MKWLDELKEAIDPAEESRGHWPKELVGRYIYTMEKNIDRLIEIAERADHKYLAESENLYLCPICHGYMNHSSDCPYSDEWRKE